MAWLRIDDRFRTHPKMHKAGLAGWLAFCGICYCREHLTDGIIPREAVQTLAPGLRTPYTHAAKLVQIGLWHEHADGYQVHDFLDWNPSRKEVMSLRDKERDKKRTQRDVPEGQTRDPRAGARTGAGDAGSGLGSVQDLGSENPEESARETTAPWHPTSRHVGLIDGRAQRQHGQHGWCSLPREGLCVPEFLHREFIGKLGTPTAHADLRAWYPRVLAEVDGVAIGEDALVFWRNQFAQWVGVATSAPSARPPSRGEQTLRAAQRAAERRVALKAGGA